MVKIPVNWDKVGTEGKVKINCEDNATFTSQSPALEVNGDVVSTNISAIASDISAQSTQISALGSRLDTVESALPSGTAKATTSMVIESGEVSGLEDSTGRFYSDGLAFKRIHSVWFGAREAGPSIEIGAGPSSGPIYLRRYNSSNNIEKQATLFDTNGDASFPGVVAAATFSGELNGNAATASSAAQASNANTVASLAVSSGRNNIPNQVMRTDSSGIAQFGKIDTLATDLSSSPMTKVYCSDNNEIKSKSVDNFINALGFGYTKLNTENLDSGTFSVDVTGYKAIVAIGRAGRYTPHQTLFLPLDVLSTERSYSISYGYDAQYTYASFVVTNNILTVTWGGTNNSGYFSEFYGVK